MSAPEEEVTSLLTILDEAQPRGGSWTPEDALDLTDNLMGWCLRLEAGAAKDSRERRDRCFELVRSWAEVFEFAPAKSSAKLLPLLRWRLRRCQDLDDLTAAWSLPDCQGFEDHWEPVLELLGTLGDRLLFSPTAFVGPATWDLFMGSLGELLREVRRARAAISREEREVLVRFLEGLPPRAEELAELLEALERDALPPTMVESFVASALRDHDPLLNDMRHGR